jgi:hypothetical protein
MAPLHIMIPNSVGIWAQMDLIDYHQRILSTAVLSVILQYDSGGELLGNCIAT